LTGTAPGAVATSAIVHPSVSEPIRQLAEQGFTLIDLPVDSAGSIDAAPLPENVRLVAVMLANHETGALQPIARWRTLNEQVAFHCDAAAAAGKMPISFRQLGVTTLTISAHKFHGP